MDTVDKATGAIPSPIPSDDAAGGSGQAAQAAEVPAAPRGQEPMNLPSPPSATSGAGKQAQPIHGPGSPIITPQAVGDLLSAGAALLNQLGQSLRQAADGGPQRDISAGLGGLLSRDDATGQTYLKLPLPNQDVLQPLLNMLLAYAGKS